MMDFPKVSVILTIYNREKYIEKCIRSLLEQTLDHVEIVVVDDASTDSSLAILNNVLEEYPDRKPQVNLICLEKNAGRAVARQTGINHVKGEYVIHVDSDDWVDSDMLELLYSKAKETDADIVGCNVTHEYRTRQRIFKQSYSGDVEEDIRRLLNGKLFPSLCTSLTRTSIIRENDITFPQGVDTGEDLLFNLNLYLYAHKVVGIDNPSYHYRHTEDSGSFQHTEKSIKSVIEVARRIETLMRETGYYEKYERDILFRKFSMKCALVTDFKNKDYNKEWLNLFPETHSYIWKYKQFSWKRRVELWLAAHNMFTLARCFQKMLKIQHKVRHL
jgi:glycosyltransferase involved in cell wall biosynthesis